MFHTDGGELDGRDHTDDQNFLRVRPIRLFLILKNFKAEIYSCEKTFERIHLGAIFGSNAPYFIAGWRSDFTDQVNTNPLQNTSSM